MKTIHKQRELFKKSKELQEAAWNADCKKSKEIRKEQTELYHKFLFYKNFNKAKDRGVSKDD